MAGCSVMLLKIHELQGYMEEFHYDMNQFSVYIKQKVKEITDMENLLIFNHIFRSNEFIIATEMETSEQKRLARRILDAFTKEGKSPITIAVSEHTYTMESIHNAYVQSVSVLMTRPFNRSSMVLFCNQEEKSIQKRVKNRISQEQEMQMKALIKNGNIKALKELIMTGIGMSSCAEDGWGYLEVRQTVKKICNTLIDYLLMNEQTELVREMESLVEMADKMVERLDARLLCEIQMEIVDNIASELKNDITGSIKDVVRQAVEYIGQNYFEELTLASLSEKYSVESSYFSRLFKQETGKNLMLYIAEKRIEKAIEYMKDESVNLTEIAFLTGYDDYTYFSKVFKKIMGKSPRDYRMECR